MQSKLTNREYLQTILNRAAIQLTKTSGQHFLICEEVLEASLAALDGGPKQATELGAGVGTLTAALVGGGWSVRAIEKDKRCAELLEKCVPASQLDRLEVRVGDLKDIDWSWPNDYIVVGNIPYNLSGTIVRKLTQLQSAPHQALLLVQAEVAQRLAARPPEMHLNSLAVQLWGEAKIIMYVPANCFFPPPKVKSALVYMRPHTQGLSMEHREAVLAFAKPFFQARRKQLGGTLRRVTGKTLAQANALLEKIDIKPAQRPQELSTDQWVSLYRECEPG